MREANEEQCRILDEKIKDAEENLGDVEVRDAFLAKADYLCQIGAFHLVMQSRLSAGCATGLLATFYGNEGAYVGASGSGAAASKLW